VPFVYAQRDIDALFAACGTEFTDERIAPTLRTAIGLLAATGLRIGEALNLRVPDIDQHNDLLLIRAAKSHERFVPVHPSTAALLHFIALPARKVTRPDPSGPVFVTGKGTGYV
jgi:integrase